MPVFVQGTEWLALLVAVASTVLVALLAVAVILLLRRGGLGRGPPGVPSPDTAAYAVAMLRRLEDEHAALGQTLERAQADAARARRLSELGATLDLDELLSHALEVASQLAQADIAVLRFTPPETPAPVVAALGLTPDEAALRALSEIAAVSEARTVALTYVDGAGREDWIAGGYVVGLSRDNESRGILGVFWRGSRRELSDTELGDLTELADYLTLVIENAWRFRSARELAEIDPLTGLHNRRYFHDTLDREVKRAQRYGRPLALVLFDIDDFKAINDRLGHLAGDAVLAELGARVRQAVRAADVPCRVGGDELGVILPESDTRDGEQLSRRVQESVTVRPFPLAGRLYLSAGITELRADDDREALFERADRALYRAKAAGRGHVEPADTAG